MQEVLLQRVERAKVDPDTGDAPRNGLQVRGGKKAKTDTEVPSLLGFPKSSPRICMQLVGVGVEGPPRGVGKLDSREGSQEGVCI